MSTSTASVKADSREQQQQSLEPIVYCGTYGLKISAVSSDIQRLLEAYLSVNTTEFPAFKKIWTDINFSFIHFGCTDKHGREDFMNVVYAITLGQWLSLSDDQDSGSAEVSEDVKSLRVRTNIAVIFMLYLLYHTQPDLFPKYLIRTTIGQYKRLTDFLDHLIKDEMEPEHRDAVYVLNLLFKLPAFYVSAWEGGTPPKMIPKRSASATSRAEDLANRQPVLSLFDDVVSWKRNRWVLSQAGEGFMATIRPEVVWELQRKPRGLSSITMGPDDPTLQSLTNEVLGFSVEPSQSLTAPSDSQATSLSLADLAAAYAAHKSLIPESILQPHQKAAMLIPPTKFTDTLYSILSNHQQQKIEVIDLAVKGEPVPVYPPVSFDSFDSSSPAIRGNTGRLRRIESIETRPPSVALNLGTTQVGRSQVVDSQATRYGKRRFVPAHARGLLEDLVDSSSAAGVGKGTDIGGSTERRSVGSRTGRGRVRGRVKGKGKAAVGGHLQGSIDQPAMTPTEDAWLNVDESSKLGMASLNQMPDVMNNRESLGSPNEPEAMQIDHGVVEDEDEGDDDDRVDQKLEELLNRIQNQG